MIKKRGWIECPECGNRVSLTIIAQTLWLHGPRKSPCPMSGVSVNDIYRPNGQPPVRIKRS